MLYVGLFIHGVLAWFYYMKQPFLAIFGASWWKFVDYFYEVCERVMILEGIDLLGVEVSPSDSDCSAPIKLMESRFEQFFLWRTHSISVAFLRRLC